LAIAVPTAEIWFTYQGSEGACSGEANTSSSKLGFKSQLLAALALYVGLFFVEYPPIFLLGYWSWGAVVHKTITGVLLILNLLATQYAAKRLGILQPIQKADRGAANERVPGS